MASDQASSRLATMLRMLKPKGKEPVSAKVLNTWIAQAEGQLGDEARGGRLGWLIARRLRLPRSSVLWTRMGVGCSC